jgi:hypothetical protein
MPRGIRAATARDRSAALGRFLDVAMHVGNGMQVAATHTGSTVKLQSAFQDEIVGCSRPTG